MRTEFPVWNDEKFLETDGGDDCTINNMTILNTTELHT